MLTWQEAELLQQQIDETARFIESCWSEKLNALKAKLQTSRDVARAMVDAELHEHGYDSLRFADYRAGWLSLENQLSAILQETP